ncbi:MAG TPA: VanZ family protein [Gammaproteobacteria bacterium]|nr:VanZ family protein [Gammaproteobacteria bacterium]
MASAARTRLWAGLWLIWMALIALSSQLPGADLPAFPFEGADKAVHILFYLVLGGLGVGAVARLRPDWPRPLVGSAALVAGALFGAADEYHQAFVAGRHTSMEDWLTDLLGLALAVIAARAARGGLARAWLGGEGGPA